VWFVYLRIHNVELLKLRMDREPRQLITVHHPAERLLEPVSLAFEFACQETLKTDWDFLTGDTAQQ
jgi:hypothetical protein